MKLKTEILTEDLYEISSLVSLYRNFAKSFPKKTLEVKNSQKEMKTVKEKILRQLLEMKKRVKKMESELAPRM